MSVRCRNCNATLGSDVTQLDWEGICPYCGELTWLAAGDTVSCRITRVSPFGIFVELGDEVQGMIHISELSHDTVRHPSEIVSQGETLQAKVLRIDVEEKRIGLSRKRVRP